MRDVSFFSGQMVLLQKVTVAPFFTSYSNTSQCCENVKLVYKKAGLSLFLSCGQVIVFSLLPIISRRSTELKVTTYRIIMEPYMQAQILTLTCKAGRITAVLLKMCIKGSYSASNKSMPFVQLKLEINGFLLYYIKISRIQNPPLGCSMCTSYASYCNSWEPLQRRRVCPPNFNTQSLAANAWRIFSVPSLQRDYLNW